MGVQLRSLTGAFANCSRLKSIDILPTVAEIFDGAFSKTSLDMVFIPNTVVFVGTDVFSRKDGGKLNIFCQAKSFPYYWSPKFNGSNNVCWDVSSFGNENGLIWFSTNENNYAVVIGYNGTNTELIIPDIINEIPVAKIGEDAFKQNSRISSVTIGSNVTKIEGGAFASCTQIKTVVFGNKLYSIGNNAFYNCENLESVILPESVIEIGESAFEGCTWLKEIKLSSRLYKIGSRAFAYCNLTEIVIPKSVVEIGYAILKGFNNTIYCEIDSKPADWDEYWINDYNYFGEIKWGYSSN